VRGNPHRPTKKHDVRRWSEDEQMRGSEFTPAKVTSFLPSHDGRLQIGLKLIRVIFERLPLDNIQVTEEHEAEDGVPHRLIDQNFRGDSYGLRAGKFGVEESIEIMSGSSVDEESERSKTNRTHNVVGLAIVVDELLGKDVTDGETRERGECLGEKRLCLKHSVVSGPDSTHIFRISGWWKREKTRRRS
jgi:hypothetical protein